MGSKVKVQIWLKGEGIRIDCRRRVQSMCYSFLLLIQWQCCSIISNCRPLSNTPRQQLGGAALLTDWRWMSGNDEGWCMGSAARWMLTLSNEMRERWPSQQSHRRRPSRTRSVHRCSYTHCRRRNPRCRQKHQSGACRSLTENWPATGSPAIWMHCMADRNLLLADSSCDRPCTTISSSISSNIRQCSQSFYGAV